MSKIVYEFDTSLQEPGLTQTQITQSINQFATDNGFGSLIVHETRTALSKKPIEGWITYGAGELTLTDVANVTAILAAQPGLVGYTPALPDPPAISDFGNLKTVGGIVSAMTLPTIAGLAFASFVVQWASETGNGVTVGTYWDTGSGMTYLDLNPTFAPQHQFMMVQIVNREQNAANHPAVLTIPSATSIQLVANSGPTLNLTRSSDIVLTANGTVDSTLGRYWVDAAGKMYLALERDGLKGNTAFRSFEDAVAIGAI